MSNYNNLKGSINNNIYENQTQQITGTVMNTILNEMTNVLGAGYQFAGVATVGMNPGGPDARVFYLAGEGIYTNFGNLQVPQGHLGILKWDSHWHLETIEGLGGGGANLTGYVSLASTDDLPDEGVATLGYLCGTNLYLYVGEGGDTKEGKYQNCGSFRGPQGIQGDRGVSVQSVVQTTTSTEDEGINIITCTLEDGTQSTFQIKNGSKGSQGIQGPQGVQGEPGRLQAQYKQVETLPTASADTVDYIYLVESDTPNVYDMYYTEENQGAYSWQPLGTTAVQLSDYATKAEVSQLEHKVDGIEKKDLEVPVTFVEVYGIAQAYSGKMNSGSTGYRMAYYVAPKNCVVKIKYRRSTNSSYNGRYGVVSSVSELAIGQTPSFIGRFDADTDETYTTSLTAGQVVYCMLNYQDDYFELYLVTEMDTVDTVEGLLLAPDTDKPRLDFLFDKDYSEVSVSPSSISTDRILQQIGVYDSKVGYNIAVYEVNANEILHLRFAKVAPAVWQFQNTSSMTTIESTAQTYLVGNVHIAETDEYIVVPPGATHLLVCQLPSNENRLSRVLPLSQLRFDILGNGTNPVTKTITLKEGKRYIARVDNFMRGDTRVGYVVLKLSCGGNTICEYKGGELVPDAISVDVPVGETQVTLYCRIASGIVCTISFDEVNNPGIFDFNDYGKEFVRLNNASKKMESGGVPPFVLLHFSDIHADTTRLKRLLSYYDIMSVGIDDILHTGDSVRDRADATSFDFWDECGAEKVMNCIGNHDVWYADDFTPEANYVYDTYLKPYIDNEDWGEVIQPEDAETNGLCYYYKDYASKGIRLVVLDYRTTSAQVPWLSDVLADAIVQGLSVIAAIHYPIEMTTPFDTAFDISRFASVGTTTASAFVNAIDTFIADGGEFVCWLTGHTHKDFCGVKEISGRKQVAVCIDCAALLNDGLTRYRGEQSKSQDCFNLLSVNVNKKLLTIWRVGEDTDALQRHKGSMCINYVTGELIYTD